MLKTAKNPSPKQVLKAIHDKLYLDTTYSREPFYNGKKEWSVDFLEEIADLVETVISRPAPLDICAECDKPYAEGTGSDGKCRTCALKHSHKD